MFDPTCQAEILTLPHEAQTVGLLRCYGNPDHILHDGSRIALSLACLAMFTRARLGLDPDPLDREASRRVCG